ncbi:asparagine synthase (glutamine-hydrolyzing) [Tsuneonella troitsensis]|uniref:asparagine synthase (glutamine-hydrolyzing) n=1 Tax=Tsuneonella troitsensis TaxID=292222 RepID=UPI00070B194C|nr:asparagine synthase (glutamine-hydrolyzing) [Tsuneonella troitsensis]
MCGLTGFWTPSGFDEGHAQRLLAPMVGAIAKRGPDAEGVWVDGRAGVALGHRRLAVLELSEAGAQPMASRSGRYVLVFNGEIYNHLALRDELAQNGAAPSFRGHSDTETLLAGFDAWGIASTLAKCIGMFALACWDRSDGALHLARDRMGEKPLYYGWQGDGGSRTMLFGSELKAIVPHPSFEARIDETSLGQYFARLCVPGIRSIWSGIRKVAPGTIVRMTADGTEDEQVFWSLDETIREGARQRIGDPDEALNLVHESLANAIESQMISDVPLGAFLSGGVDSSLVVALMQRASSCKVKTFSIGFEDSEHNEAHHARAVADHLGTDHAEMLVTSRDAQSVIPDLPTIYDEPFADSSQIPTLLVAGFARRHVTVALSGDGADELFGGYTRYGKALAAWNRIQALPPFLRNLGASAVSAAAPLLPSSVVRAGSAAGAADLATMYGRYTDHTVGFFSTAAETRDAPLPGGLAPAETLMARDQRTYLPDDILVKVDRAAMAVSLETRAPYLDARVVAASWRLHADIKRRMVDGVVVPKWPLRRILYRYVPREIIERPKHGFSIPIQSWLRGSLRDWAGDHLSHDALRGSGLIDAKKTGALWDAHLASRADHGELLWAILMLQAWLSQNSRPALRNGSTRV